MQEIPGGLIQAYSVEDSNVCLLVTGNSLKLFDLTSLTDLNVVNLGGTN